MADPRLTIAKRELSSLSREKTIVLILVLQLFVAAFSSFLVVGLVSLYDPGQTASYEVDVAIAGDATDELVAAANEVTGVDPHVYPDEATATSAFERPTQTGIDAVLVGESRDGRVYVSAAVPDSNVQTTVVVVQLREVLQHLERAEREDRSAWLETRPVDVPPETSSSPYYGFTYTVLVPLLCFLPVFISGSLTVDALSEERERGTLELLRVAPVSLREIVDGKLLAAVVLAPAQAALWMTLLSLDGTRIANPVSVVVLVGALSLLVCSLAATVALVSPERRTAQFLYSVGVLFVFGGTTLVPNNPVNTVARLAIGSTDATAAFVVAAYAVVGVGVYVALRSLVGDVDANAL
ncbi:ABC transporter permease [Halogeometricum limi]|uniref:ABC-type Na+ efflux pump, permease component n=1 Tax=Halogeometricum limi TaxID=555875 RepID=A0A1I6GIP7_9EURY|nr:ABC transporter permease [Halogeometricum limi]SFR42019.1 ABC-type Na+ efflux pump, permease component [Halogeometricum limi]